MVALGLLQNPWDNVISPCLGLKVYCCFFQGSVGLFQKAAAGNFPVEDGALLGVSQKQLCRDVKRESIEDPSSQGQNSLGPNCFGVPGGRHPPLHVLLSWERGI